MTRIVGVGAGGHAKILAELLVEIGGYELVGFTDANVKRRGEVLKGSPILGGDERLAALRANGVSAAFIGVGAVTVAGTRLRATLFARALGAGLQLPSLIHPRALVAPSVRTGEGAVVLGGAILSTDVSLGANVTVYSGVVIEHDSAVEAHAHLSPGAHLAGGVLVGEGAFIGIGASIIQGVRIGAWATVGAGAVVLRDVPAGAVAVGVPARLTGRASV